MDPKVILVDMDGVLEDLSTAWLNWLDKKYHTNIHKEDIKSWDLDGYFPTLTHQQIREPLLIDEFWDDVKPFNDAIIYLKKIIDYGHKVYICTNTHYGTAKAKFDKVLFTNFPYLNWKQLIICTDKHMVRADYLIDDHAENFIDGEYKGILYTQHHNLHYNADDFNAIRMNSWEEIYNYFCK